MPSSSTRPPNTTESATLRTPEGDTQTTREYIRFQACIWLLFSTTSAISFIWHRPPDGAAGVIAFKVFDIVALSLSSHVLWLVARRWDWLRQLKRFWLHGLCACIVCGTLIAAVTAPFSVPLHLPGSLSFGAPDSTLRLYFCYALDNTLLLILWAVFYSATFQTLLGRRLELERTRMLATASEAQYIALKGQINPHFLFNSLNTVRALIQDDPAAARDAVTRLADILRYTLAMSDYRTVAVQDELALIKDYLALESLRHEERLQTQITVAPECLRATIPPMLLQTLVENAVKHGLSQRAKGILMTCDIWTEQTHAAQPACLRIRVANEGRLAGDTAEGAHKGDAAKPDSKKSGIGLRNTRERLHHLYGARATLDVTQQNERVVADVTVPFIYSQ